MNLTSRKRPIDLTGVVDANPSKKDLHSNPNPRSEEALLEVRRTYLESIKQADEIRRKAQEKLKWAEGALQSHRQQTSDTRDYELESKTIEDDNDSKQYIYVVKETSYKNTEDQEGEEEIEGYFATLEDANHRARNLCSLYADRDDPEANYFEGYLEQSIYWEYRYENGSGTAIDVEKREIVRAGAEPVEDWGRDIGVPCPPASETEQEDDDSESEESEESDGYNYGRGCGRKFG